VDPIRRAFEYAGVVGINPRPLTLRELDWMATARQQCDWGHTSSLMALLAELKRNRRKKITAYTPDDFNPTVQHAADDSSNAPPVSVATMAAMVPGSKYTPTNEPKPNDEPKG
jgi:hypothetical protein